MRIVNTVKVSMRALRRNTLRSVLTALGIIIGVGAVIAMVSIGNGAKSQIEGQIASLGQNVVTIFPGSQSSGGMRGGWGSASTLTPEECNAIPLEVPGAIASSPEVRDRQQVMGNGLNWNTQVMGVGPDYPQIRSWPLEEGSMFGEGEVKTLGKVAIIGKTVADQLFPNEDPMGKVLRIRNLPFKIVGVMKAKGFNLFGQDQDDVVFIPYTSHMKRISKRDRINSILVQAASAEAIPSVQQGITDLLMQRRAGKEQDFTVRNQVEFAQMATETSKVMTLLLSAIAGVSLLVGGIGIMNIMLVSVTERTREIGIRLAIGAHGSDVLLQFLTEAIILSCLGGLLGIGLGVGSSLVISKYAGWPVLVSTGSVLMAFGISAAIGIFFGYYPARKAAQLDPIEALRYE